MMETLAVETDHFCFFVLSEKLEQLIFTDNCFVAVTDKGGKTQISSGEIEEGGTERSTLREEGNGAWLGHAFGKGSVQSQGGVEKTKTVRTKERDIVAFGQLNDCLFECFATVTGLFEPRGDDNSGTDTLLTCFT